MSKVIVFLGIIGVIIILNYWYKQYKKKKYRREYEEEQRQQQIEEERQRQLERERRIEEQKKIEQERERRDKQRKEFIIQNIDKVSKIERYKYLRELRALLSQEEEKQLQPFFAQKLRETIIHEGFNFDLDIEKSLALSVYVNGEEEKNIYNELSKEIIAYIDKLTFSDYENFDAIKTEFLLLKKQYLKFQIDDFIQKIKVKENEILGQYNGKYPYADKKCYYSVKGLVVNKRVWKGEVYYDTENGIETEFYVFDDIVEIQNLNGISSFYIQDVFKTEVYNNSIILVYFSNGSVMNFYFEKEYVRDYFEKVIKRIKNKAKEVKTSVEANQKDGIELLNEQLVEKTNGNLHSFEREPEILWWKIGKSNVWLRLGDWDNNNKLYFAFWSNYNNSQYHNYRYDNDGNKEFFKLYKAASFDFVTFKDFINGGKISPEKVNVLINEVLDFYKNHSIDGKTITDIINECNS